MIIVSQRVKPLTNHRPLHHQSAQQKIESYSAVAVTSQERHQEPEADKHHHMNILKHCNKEEKFNNQSINSKFKYGNNCSRE